MGGIHGFFNITHRMTLCPAITIWLTDQLDPSISGLAIGERYSARIWSPNEKIEQIIKLESFSEGNNNFEHNGIAVLSKLSIIGENYSDISYVQVLRNPASSSAQINL